MLVFPGARKPATYYSGTPWIVRLPGGAAIYTVSRHSFMNYHPGKVKGMAAERFIEYAREVVA
jgi:hypothetical protein